MNVTIEQMMAVYALEIAKSKSNALRRDFEHRAQGQTPGTPEAIELARSMRPEMEAAIAAYLPPLRVLDEEEKLHGGLHPDIAQLRDRLKDWVARERATMIVLDSLLGANIPPRFQQAPGRA